MASSKLNYMDDDKFIFCLEAVPDVETEPITETFKSLEKLALEQGVDSIYKTCDTIEGLEESINTLLYSDHNFKNYEIIYLVMPGEGNNMPEQLLLPPRRNCRSF